MPDPTPTYVKVALPGIRSGLLTYSVPQGTSVSELSGCRVLVPLGNRSVVGVALGEDSAPPEGVRVKPVEEVLDSAPSLPKETLELALWVSDYYLTPLGETLRAALPAGLLRDPQWKLTWTGAEIFEAQWPEEVQGDRTLLKAAKLVAEHSPLGLAELKKAWGKVGGLLGALRQLEHLNLVAIEDTFALDPDTAHTEEWVIAGEAAKLEAIPERATAQRRFLQELLDSAGSEATWSELRDRANASRANLTKLEELGLVTVERRPKGIVNAGFDPRAGSDAGSPLNGEQSIAVKRLHDSLQAEKFASFLLRGLPGTGKTRVYIEAMREALALGRGVLLLVPEIGLTPQVIARIQAAVNEPVAVLHSGMSAAKRVAAWRELLEGRARIAVGARSAVFAPVPDLGLVIVDEEHEEAYKQQEPEPRYHARDVALVRAQKLKATALLVSATPSLEVVRLVDEGQIEPLDLKHRYGSGWPTITVVDRRREEADAPYIGAHLAREIESRAKRGEGVVLLVTRRGYAPVLVCNNCGERFECPDCSVPLTYHTGRREPALRCHLCGHTRRVPDTCESCHGELRPLGLGTQRIEEEIRAKFPQLAPVRMDADTTRGRGEHERILRAFGAGESGLLLGTQVVAKGHDFDHVTLVGVVNADPALFQPDFRASERTFRLLVQAAGRAGRGDKHGEVVIQSLDPDNPVFSALMVPDIESFNREQLKTRHELGYPPFVRMISLTITADDERAAEGGARLIAAQFEPHRNWISVRGPVPANIARVKRKWRQRLLLSVDRERDPRGDRLRKLVREVSANVKLPAGCLSVMDVDPLEVT